MGIKGDIFSYDKLNRLIDVAGGARGSNIRYSKDALTYNDLGNITSKKTVGTFSYNNSSKPYALTNVRATTNAVASIDQQLFYTSFERPHGILEGRYEALWTYNGRGERVEMSLKKNGYQELIRYYLGNNYEFEVLAGYTKEYLYLGGDYYSAPAVLIRNAGSWTLHYICRDYLGSITQITNQQGTVLQELSYDAWGQLRNPVTLNAYGPRTQTLMLLSRGYTGHEHLSEFGLINMNARLYDPVLGRFLSPDPYVQMPDFSQNFNRYSYCLNNPLRYVDQDGEWIHILIGAVVGGVGNLAYKAFTGQINGWGDGFAAFGIGAVAGGIGAATGGLAFAAAGGAAAGTGGFMAGAAAGAAASAVSMPIQSAGNNIAFGDPFMSPQDYVLGVAGGAFLGGSINGGIAGYNGKNFWSGNNRLGGSNMFSFTNSPKTELGKMPTLSTT
ncbi:hypothetical protein AwDysgo_21750 [Bacteroidales bacterium]|nr:hypothetical protein AwDysgo_21750 [Bacteroidales bacterium]